MTQLSFLTLTGSIFFQTHSLGQHHPTCSLVLFQTCLALVLVLCTVDILKYKKVYMYIGILLLEVCYSNHEITISSAPELSSHNELAVNYRYKLWCYHNQGNVRTADHAMVQWHTKDIRPAKSCYCNMFWKQCFRSLVILTTFQYYLYFMWTS